eukprot:COSAG01_NODE_113_length_25617_cov_10.523492_15_plen_61_part_00
MAAYVPPPSSSAQLGRMPEMLDSLKRGAISLPPPSLAPPSIRLLSLLLPPAFECPRPLIS